MAKMQLPDERLILLQLPTHHGLARVKPGATAL